MIGSDSLSPFGLSSCAYLHSSTAITATSRAVTRANRKYPGVHPGIQKEYKPKIAVYVDESGSVDDTSLEKFFGELHNLANCCDFTLFKFDTEVQESNKIEFKKNKLCKIYKNIKIQT